MKQLPSSTEDIFVREMILHGRKEQAIRAAFPRMLPEFIPDAIVYMMQNPEVRRRIDAGIAYFYKDYLKYADIPEVPEVSIHEKRELLQQIILRRRKHPQYIRTKDGLRMIMVQPLAEEVSDAVYMERELKEMEKAVNGMVLTSWDWKDVA